jgi:hypothetical protein
MFDGSPKQKIAPSLNNSTPIKTKTFTIPNKTNKNNSGIQDQYNNQIIILSSNDKWWVSKIPDRVAKIFTWITSPFVALLILLELVVAITMVGIISTIGAWYFNIISDQDVSIFMMSIGARLLNILKLSGVF